MKILITSGATREPIDAVRFLSNISTGHTGALLADALAQHGHAVTLLHGEGAARPKTAIQTEAFSSTENLQAQLRRLLGTENFDAVIHCAAVADYRPDKTVAGKLTSYAPEMTLHLVPTPKLLPELKRYATRPLKVIGFKLTAGANTQERAQAVAKLFAARTVDAVIQNDTADLATGDLATGDARPFSAWRSSHLQPDALAGTAALVRWLHAFLIAP